MVYSRRKLKVDSSVRSNWPSQTTNDPSEATLERFESGLKVNFGILPKCLFVWKVKFPRLTRALDAGCGATHVAVTAVVHAFARARDLERADLWLQRMRGMGQDLKPNAVTYGGVIAACARVGDVAGAEAWLAL